mgnify:CR=1 FL=1
MGREVEQLRSFLFVTSVELLDTSSSVNQSRGAVACVVWVANGTNVDAVIFCGGACFKHSTATTCDNTLTVLWMNTIFHRRNPSSRHLYDKVFYINYFQKPFVLYDLQSILFDIGWYRTNAKELHYMSLSPKINTFFEKPDKLKNFLHLSPKV